MMRIKEAIQRRKLIQQLNEEYLVSQIDSESHPFLRSRSSKFSSQTGFSPWAFSSTGDAFGGIAGDESLTGDAISEPLTSFAAFEQFQQQQQQEFLSLAQFVGEFNAKLSDGHRRALRVTWNRLSEPPKTSGRGMLKIMEKIFESLISKNPEVKHCFYRSAFVKCLEERKQQKAALRMASSNCGSCPDELRGETIVTVRDHVMFCQDCVRAYPLAASAWSMLAVAITDKMFRHTKMLRCKSSMIGGEWSKQNSLALTAGADHCTTTVSVTTPLDTEVHSLSKNLQQRVLISLHGIPTFAGGSAASSFRCRKSIELNVPRHAVSGEEGATEQCQQTGQNCKAVKRASTVRHFSHPVQRFGRSPSADGGRNAVNEKKLPCLTAAEVANRRLGQAPAFFNRTVSTSLSGMPSTSLGNSSSSATAKDGATEAVMANGEQTSISAWNCTNSSRIRRRREGPM